MAILVRHRHTMGCSLFCLRSLLSGGAYGPLRLANPPLRTINDVFKLAKRRQLGDIKNIGPGRTKEIETVVLSIAASEDESAITEGRLQVLLELEVKPELATDKRKILGLLEEWLTNRLDNGYVSVASGGILRVSVKDQQWQFVYGQIESVE
jgi:hypothetical protein